MITDTLTIYDSVFKLNETQMEYLLKSKTVSFFQTLEAQSFFNNVGVETFSYAVGYRDKITASIAGVIQKEKGLKSTFTKRAIIYGGPILSEEATEEHIIELLKIVVDQTKNKTIYIEIRNLNDYSSFKEIFKKAGFEYHPHLNFHLTCDTEESAKKRLSSSKLRQVKKSIKEGAKTREAATESEIEEFYDILLNLYRTKVKTPLPNLGFFITLWNQRVAKIFLVFFNDKIVGGIVCPFMENKVIYEWYVCGEDRKYKNIYPSVLATWAAIVYACENNIPRFDFMGAGKPNDNYGVREFKSKFGGELVEHGRFVYVANPLLYNLGKKAVSVLKKL